MLGKVELSVGVSNLAFEARIKREKIAFKENTPNENRLGVNVNTCALELQTV